MSNWIESIGKKLPELIQKEVDGKGIDKSSFKSAEDFY